MRKLHNSVLMVLVCLAPAIGCHGTVAEPIPAVEADGVITYDGQPVTSGIISFIPADADERSSSGGAIANGKYHVYPEARLKPGKYRVEIRWSRATGEKKEAGYGQSPDVFAEVLPDKYHSQTILTAELTGGPNALDFKLDK